MLEFVSSFFQFYLPYTENTKFPVFIMIVKVNI